MESELMASVAGCNVRTSALLHNRAQGEEINQDYDIADYLLAVKDSSGLAMTDHKYPAMWDYKKQLYERI